MMLIRLLFYFVVFYSLFKFLIRVVLPLLVTTNRVRTKMRDMNQNMADFEDQHKSATFSDTEKSNVRPASKGDYIDFEEVK